MMAVVAQFTHTDNMELTIAVTMTLREWGYIRRDLTRGSTPSGVLLDAISESIAQAQAQMTSKILVPSGA